MTIRATLAAAGPVFFRKSASTLLKSHGEQPAQPGATSASFKSPLRPSASRTSRNINHWNTSSMGGRGVFRLRATRRCGAGAVSPEDGELGGHGLYLPENNPSSTALCSEVMPVGAGTYCAVPLCNQVISAGDSAPSTQTLLGNLAMASVRDRL